MIRDNDCARTWASLTGTGKSRHCSGCDRLVHNWLAMSPEERARVQQQESAPCWLLPATVERDEATRGSPRNPASTTQKNRCR